ncbi:DUF4238 domain-containing protein [Phenylobacterium sp. J367]|uniref:DUF4238 domain-containing protein n=1 Tax=Phenylobacterium sp. J367 TaxID=2898435 RepID=UPI002150D795|nr:DUF4238 domain-containing protein [Phenylobacterium sp. J367]MCR5880804.1 DUF4238 domain-containing protein [Phenylobacterium sp. J367]
MGKQVTRRQHYVWRHHLSAWAVDDKIAVLRKVNGAKGFWTNPTNAAVERDFYKLPRLTSEDRDFIQRFVASLSIPDDMKEFALGWMMPSDVAEQSRRFLASKGALNSKSQRAIEEFEIQAGEDFMGTVEDMGLKHLDRLRRREASFWHADEDAAIEFSYFLATQHLRTKRMAELIATGQSPAMDEKRARRVWPILRSILAMTFGCSLFTDRSRWRLRTLRAGGARRFITADQPVMNLLSAESHNDMALYYPICGTLAVLLEHNENISLVDNDELDDPLVARLNQKLYDYAHEQVFGSDLEYLRTLGVPSSPSL